MKRLCLILACIALIGCVPVEVATKDAPADLPAAPPVEVDTVVEEIVVSQAAGGQVEIVGGDEEALREFIQRYFRPIYPATTDKEMTILIGSLPDDLPVEFPMLEGARIVATVQEPSAFTQVILDALQTPEEVESFYAQSMADLGWQPAPQYQPGGGFVSDWDQGGRFCLGESEAYLEVRSVERPDQPTDVRITLQAPVEYFPCQVEDAEYMDAGSQLIPTLVAPQGVQITSSGAGSSSDSSAYNSADLQTTLSIDELMTHYNAQLEQAGWEMFDQGTSEVVAWSAWKLVDENGDEWGGNLVVMDNRLGSDRRFAMVSVERVD